jgi:WD40 repeat protein
MAGRLLHCQDEQRLEPPQLLANVCGALAPDGTSFVLGNLEGTIEIWDRTASKPALRGKRSCKPWRLAFAPDGKMLATAIGSNVFPGAILDWSETSCVQLWDARTGKQLAQASGHKEMLMGLAFSHDGRDLYSASGDGTILIWDVRHLSQLRRSR